MDTRFVARRVAGLCLASALIAPFISTAAPARPPDLTRDAQPDTKLTYNLGPTGMRGWIYSKDGMTFESRQILVTQVAKGSPADGIMQVEDVILGVGGKEFDDDARVSLARAIDVSESEKSKGAMKFVVWRDGLKTNLEIRLKVMGSYTGTAPYDCPKSKRIMEDGCRYIAEKKDLGLFSLGALALLASGDEKYAPLIREEVRKLVPSEAGIKEMTENVGGKAWERGYTGILLSEYYLATGDKAVLPAIRAYAVNAAMGQGMYGTWGHGMSAPTSDGKLHGPIPPYGALNQAGLSCYFMLVLAKKCGVENEEVDQAIARSTKFFSYFVNKGTIPYGEHRPNFYAHDDNGKSGFSAVIFSALGRRSDAQFFSKMATAGFGAREYGHSGPFFSYMWGLPGANCAGPKAMAEHFKRVSWHLDLERRWDGSFSFEWTGGSFDGGNDRGLSTTAEYVLTYAQPLRKIYSTGKGATKDFWLSDRDVGEAIVAGSYDPAKKSNDELLKELGSWSPSVRRAAAEEIAKRKEDLLPQLTKIVECDDAHARIGAAHALGYLKERAAPALPVLVRLLSHEDRWLRVQAAEALKGIGDAARPALADMLKAAAIEDEADPLRLGQGALAYALFYPGGAIAGGRGMLAQSIEGVDKRLLYPAIKATSRNPDAHVRGCLRSTYTLLTLEDVKALAPEIMDSIKEMAPCNTMFSKGVRIAGIQMLERLKIEEGIPLCLVMYRLPDWGAGYIRPIALETLRKYGGAAKSILPELKKEKQDQAVIDTIAAIENDKNLPKTVSIAEYLKKK